MNKTWQYHSGNKIVYKILGTRTTPDGVHRVIDVINSQHLAHVICVDCGANWEEGGSYPKTCVNTEKYEYNYRDLEWEYNTLVDAIYQYCHVEHWENPEKGITELEALLDALERRALPPFPIVLKSKSYDNS